MLPEDFNPYRTDEETPVMYDIDTLPGIRWHCYICGLNASSSRSPVVPKVYEKTLTYHEKKERIVIKDLRYVISYCAICSHNHNL